MFDTPTTLKNVGTRARAVYDADIRHLVEQDYTGKFIAVEPESGDYVIHDQIVGAMLTMRAKRPNTYSHILRIGHKAAIVGVRGPANYRSTEQSTAKPSSRESVCSRARALYDTEICHLVEPLHTGKFIAVEPDTGEYEIDEELIAASRKLKARRPDSLSCILRIGRKAAIIR